MKIKTAILLFSACMSLMACHDKAIQEEVIHSVMTVTPTVDGAVALRNFTGTVKENAEINVGFKVPGQIEAVYVREGQHISKGQLIAVLDSKDYRLGVEASEIQYKQLRDEVKRLNQLYQTKSLSGNDYEKAVSGLEQVGVKLQSDRNKLSYTRLYAGQSGVVQAVNFHASEMVDAGTPVVTLIDNSHQQVEINIPQSIYAQRSRFVSVYGETGGHRYDLHLISVLPKIDNDQLYTLRLTAPAGLPAGATMNVTIAVEKDMMAGRVTLPQSAVFYHQGRSCVWVLAPNGTVRRRAVAVGNINDSGHIVVLSGLSGSEQVVKAGVDALHDGEKVKKAHNTTTN